MLAGGWMGTVQVCDMLELIIVTSAVRIGPAMAQVPTYLLSRRLVSCLLSWTNTTLPDVCPFQFILFSYPVKYPKITSMLINLVHWPLSRMDAFLRRSEHEESGPRGRRWARAVSKKPTEPNQPTNQPTSLAARRSKYVVRAYMNLNLRCHPVLCQPALSPRKRQGTSSWRKWAGWMWWCWRLLLLPVRAVPWCACRHAWPEDDRLDACDTPPFFFFFFFLQLSGSMFSGGGGRPGMLRENTCLCLFSGVVVCGFGEEVVTAENAHAHLHGRPPLGTCTNPRTSLEGLVAR